MRFQDSPERRACDERAIRLQTFVVTRRPGPAATGLVSLSFRLSVQSVAALFFCSHGVDEAELRGVSTVSLTSGFTRTEVIEDEDHSIVPPSSSDLVTGRINRRAPSSM